MGLVGIELKLERLRDDAQSPADAQRGLWDAVDYCIRAMISSDSPVLQNYLWSAASDGFANGDWSASDKHMMFMFSDAAGLCNVSSQAALHWLEMVLWTESGPHTQLRDAGWRITDIPMIPARRHIALSRSSVFVRLRDNLYVVSRQGRGGELTDDDLVHDDGFPALKLSALSPSELVRVEAASYGGECDCGYCFNVLEGAWLDGLPEHVRPAWNMLDELADEASAAKLAIDAFSDADWAERPTGPAALDALRDALVAKGLEVSTPCVASMLLYRTR